MNTKWNVLLVDDDDVAHIVNKRIITSVLNIGDIQSAYNWEQALIMLQEACDGKLAIPSLIVFDLHMPIMNGFELYEKVKRMECLVEMKIVTAMVSSTLDVTEIHRAGKIGIDYFFQKPLGKENIETIVRIGAH